MTRKEIRDYLLSFSDVQVSFPFGENLSVYKIGQEESGGGKMFAIIQDDSRPLQISLKCDPQLAERLREVYETVLPGKHLSKAHWNTILLTGQVPDDEFRSLVQLSYRLASGEKVTTA